MRIESGPTTERKIRNSIMAIMFAAAAIWFAYDGWVGYPAKNHEEFLGQLPATERDKARQGPVYENLRHREVNGRDYWSTEVNKALARSSVADARKSVDSLIGGSPSYESNDAWFYFGPAYQLKIPVTSGVLGSAAFVRGQKKEMDIFWQKGIALCLGGLTLYLIWFVIRVAQTRAVVDESGLVFRGTGPIRWEDMKALDNSPFARKGYVYLIYDDHGSERRLRLDEYHLARFDDVIDEICARKKFENPLPMDESAPPQTTTPV